MHNKKFHKELRKHNLINKRRFFLSYAFKNHESSNPRFVQIDLDTIGLHIKAFTPMKMSGHSQHQIKCSTLR